MAATTTLQEADDGRTVELGVGDTLEVVLPEQASSGYRWAVDACDEGLLQALDARADYGNGIAVVGLVRFQFVARRAGQGAVVLKLWRHWEGDASVQRRWRAVVQVRG